MLRVPFTPKFFVVLVPPKTSSPPLFVIFAIWILLLTCFTDTLRATDSDIDGELYLPGAELDRSRVHRWVGSGRGRGDNHNLKVFTKEEIKLFR